MAVATNDVLKGKRVLVLEDEYFIAAELGLALREAGATVLGPCARPSEAEEWLARTRPDAAVLDIELRGEFSYGIAETLAGRNTPYLFVTGYDDWHLPDPYRRAPRLTKPASGKAVVESGSAMVGAVRC